MDADQLKQIQQKYFEEYGDAGLKFMSFVLEQNLQIDLVKAAVGAALDKDETMAGHILDTFGSVHSHLTESFAKAMNLSDEMASKIFDSAGEAYELMRHKAETGDSKTND